MAAAEQRDYYEVLGVSRDADETAIKSAFRKLALKCHPDRNKAPDAEDRFKEIAEAYAILHDPSKRRQYDARGHAGVSGISPEEMFAGIDLEEILGGLGGFEFGGGLFDRMFRRRTGPRPGATLHAELIVPLAEIVTGGDREVQIRRPRPCRTCEGSGAKPGTKPKTCDSCGGTGRRAKSRREGGVTFQQITTCHDCNGRGSIIEHPCPDCGGHGETVRTETLKVRIPPGIDEGTLLRIPGHGLPGREPGGVPGDLLVAVRSEHDPRFERHGPNLWRTETIEVTDAVLGTRLTVPTLDGSVKVTVPPGTQPDAMLRLRDKGLPVPGARRRGDLFLRLQVHVPERLNDEQRALYEQLRAGIGTSAASNSS